jgi:plastocyanin
MGQTASMGRLARVATLGSAAVLAIASAAPGGRAAAAPAAQGSPGPAAGAVRVSMKDFLFAPASITVHAGQSVTWTYDESATDLTPNCETVALQLAGSPVTCPGHSTTADSNGPDGKPLWDSGVHRAPGFPYSVRFTVPGTYAYHCTVHGGRNPNNPVTHMNGTVVVLAAASPAVQTPAPLPNFVVTQPPAGGTGASTSGSGTLPQTGHLPGRDWGLGALLLAAAAAFGRRWIGRRGQLGQD